MASSFPLLFAPRWSYAVIIVLSSVCPAQAGTGGVPGIAPIAAAVPLAPHKALYEISMLSAKTGSQMVDIAGRMFFEWRPGCDGYTTNHRFQLKYEYDDENPATMVSSEFSTFESLDGKMINFTARRRKDGEVYEDLRGRASRDPGGKGKAVYSLPESMSYNLPSNTVFPTTQTLALLDAARKGQKFLNMPIFDGSDESGPVEVNSFIAPMDDNAGGKMKSGFSPVKNTAVDDSLLNNKAWKIRMAFFPVESDNASSDYELSMVFHENGIISDMVIEYSDFTVRQKLVALEKLKPETCGN